MNLERDFGFNLEREFGFNLERELILGSRHIKLCNLAQNCWFPKLLSFETKFYLTLT